MIAHSAPWRAEPAMSVNAAGIERLIRPPRTVMHLDRMGCLHQTRLSFMRSLIRLMHRENWTIQRVRWEMDAQGYGVAIYTVTTPGRDYSLVAFSNELDDADRTDRVIAERWDATFALTEGTPDDQGIERLRGCVPLQEAGRCSAAELVLSRANKSVRLFDYVVDCLVRGMQPEIPRLAEVGYLMRTTAVYGNGKFGLADREKVMRDECMRSPYRAELLAVYLIRCFTHDLVNHIASVRGGGRSVELEPVRRRILGIGNATGLGMAPYLHKHPALLNNWYLARETALARVRDVQTATPDKAERFGALLDRAVRHVREWHTDDALQTDRIAGLSADLQRIQGRPIEECCPWHKLMKWAEENVSLEAQEMLASLVMEPYPELVDELESSMGADESASIEPGMKLDELTGIIEKQYDWALEYDFERADASHWFWYVSKEKLEPRIGVRLEETGADREMPLGVARDVQQLYRDLAAAAEPKQTVALFLALNPEHRHIVRRIQNMARTPYGEIRDNLLGENMRPIDMLRCKLAFFGASKFDPKSDRWTRITMYQGAPLPQELQADNADDWCFPVIGEGAATASDPG